jgi:hypothetical protein
MAHRRNILNKNKQNRIMATTRILATNVSFFLGAVLVGCVKSMDITVTKTKIATKCQGSGGINTAIPGNAEYSWSCDGIETVYTSGELSSNVSVNSFWDGCNAGTEVTIVYGGTVADDDVETLVGHVSTVSKKGQVDGESTYTASGWGNSYARTVVA